MFNKNMFNKFFWFLIAFIMIGFIFLLLVNKALKVKEVVDNTVEPVVSEVSESQIIKLYFNNPKLDPEMLDCSKVFAVEREVGKMDGLEMFTLEKLLEGLTDDEKAQGYTTNINTGVEIQDFFVDNNVAYVDFNNQLEQGVGGSCKTAAIIAQIKETLKQFDDIKDVVISIDGRTEDILQP